MTVLKGVRIYRPLGTGDKAHDRTARESTNVRQEAEVDSSLDTLLGSSQSGTGDSGYHHPASQEYVGGDSSQEYVDGDSSSYPMTPSGLKYLHRHVHSHTHPHIHSHTNK